MKKKFLSSFMALCLALTLLPTVAAAADVSSADTLAAALNTITPGCCEVDAADTTKVTMQQNVTLTETITITSGAVVLNLNGHTITGANGGDTWVYNGACGKTALAVTGGALTLTDSASGGKVIGGNGNGSANTWKDGPVGGDGLSVNGGVVTISGGTLEGGIGGTQSSRAGGRGGYGISVQSGMVSVAGGTFTGGAGGGGSSGGAQGSAVVINGGSVSGNLSGTPTNGSGTEVQPYTLTVNRADGSALAGTAVTALTATDKLGYTYGMTGVKTDANGKLYVYLPAGKTAVSVTADGTTYSGSVANGTPNTATLTPVHTHCVCGGSVTTGDHTSHSAVLTYLPLPADYTGGPLEGSYYLTGDTSLANTLYIAAGKTLNLCLNGRTLTAAAEYVTDDGNHSYSGVINNDGTLNLCDCTSEMRCGQWNEGYTAYTVSAEQPASGAFDTLTGGVVTGWSNGDGGSGIANSGTLNFYGGSVAGNQGGGVGSWSDSALTLYGGVIAGNRLTGVPNPDDYSGGGAGIYAQDAAVTMYGGRVSGNTALPDQTNHGGDGGGVYVGHFFPGGSSSFTMAGGSIEGNRASSTGGGVCFDGSSSFAMTGGSITGNSAAAGGGICANNTFSLSGNVTISGNSANVIGANLLLFSMEGAEPKVQISAALTSTTPVGVSILGADGEGKPVYAGGVFTTGNTATNSDYLAKFTSDSGDFAVRAAADSQLQLAKVSPSAPAAPGTPAVTVPVSSDAGKASVSATVTNETASVSVTDSQLKAIISDSTDTGTVKVDVSGLKDVTAASLPAKLVDAAAKASGGTGLTVSVPGGSVALDSTALVAVNTGNTVVVSVDPVAREKLSDSQRASVPENAVIVDVNVLVNGAKVHDFSGGRITVSIPYTPKTGETPDSVTVWYLEDDGSLTPMNGKYDPASGMVVFTTIHLSQYVIGSFPFTDVPDIAYYYPAVVWAVGNGVADGTSATIFAPDGVCTRAQVVTFLWRAMGSPEPTGKAVPFTDAAAEAYYYKAVQWAAEKGITLGTSATTFSPGETVTRAQTMTFLYRTAGKPAADTANPFADVAAGAYYESAVLWAAARKITQGTAPGVFSPAAPCTRGQIVTFLYRALGK